MAANDIFQPSGDYRQHDLRCLVSHGELSLRLELLSESGIRQRSIACAQGWDRRAQWSVSLRSWRAVPKSKLLVFQLLGRRGVLDAVVIALAAATGRSQV